jgi:hypothetical protein
MRKATPSTPPVTMEDVFQALDHYKSEHGIRLAVELFPVMNDAVPAKYGMVVRARNRDGHVIREVTCSHTYWPSDKYTSWEAAALACIQEVDKSITDEYLPLIGYLSREY